VGDGVEVGVGAGVGVTLGVGVGVAAPEQADRSIRVAPASQRTGYRVRGILTILEAASGSIGA
jgi:hypothetical protein